MNELRLHAVFKLISSSIYWFVITIRQKIGQNNHTLQIPNPLTIIYQHKTEELHTPP